MACRTGCPTGDHATWGECARAANVRVAWAASAKGFDLTAEKKADRELDAYADARRQGIQPAGTRMAQVEAAVRVSDATGSAFQAGV